MELFTVEAKEDRSRKIQIMNKTQHMVLKKGTFFSLCK